MTRLVLEGFAGPGGWSQGMAALGHTTAVGVELDRDACRTAVAAGHARVQADVAAFPLAHLAGRVDGIVLSPPCQGFSKAGNRLGLLDQPALYDHLAKVAAAGRWVDYDPTGWYDPRSPLVLQPVRWIDQLRPRWVALEQVPAVLPFWEALARWARGLGYSTATGLLSAEQFGVPQTRLRAFLAARNDGQPARLPSPSHARYVPARRADEPAADGLFVEPARERAVHPADGGLLPWVSMAEALDFGLVGSPSPVVMTARGRQAGGSDVLRGSSWRADWWRRAQADPARWLLETEQTSGTAAGRVPIVRRDDQPAPTLVANADRWELRNVQDNATAQGTDQPAGTVFCSRPGNLRWQYRNGNQDHTAIRDQDQPAPTVHFGARSNKVDRVAERPATAVCGDPRLAGPGHWDREGGQRQYDEQAVRVDVWQAGVLQGFTSDYPWRGTRTAQFRQCGDAVPPPLTAAVTGELLDVDWKTQLWKEAR